jgi:WD40 repeat protein
VGAWFGSGGLHAGAGVGRLGFRVRAWGDVMRVLVVVFVLGIAGCGGDSSPSGGGAVPAPADSQTQKSVARRETLTFEGHKRGGSCVCFSPDGKRIVSCSEETVGKVWDAQTGQEVLTLIQNEYVGGMTCVKFSPDGKRIVSGTTAGRVQVWDSDTGREPLEVNGHHSGLVWSVCFSPDGQQIVSVVRLPGATEVQQVREPAQLPDHD